MLTSSFRRTWFLERVLKLGLVQIAKEYQCVSHWTSTSHPRHSDPFISLRHSPQHVQILRTAHASWKRSGSKPIKPYFASVRSRNPHLPGIPCQRPLTSLHTHRTLPTVNGLPLPPHARGRQPPALAYPSQLPDDREGVRRHTYVALSPLPLIHAFTHLSHRYT